MNLIKSTSIVIIDFDNFFKIKESSFDRSFNFIIKEIIKDIVHEAVSGHDIRIRLYGGWYTNSIFSDSASVLAKKLSDVNIFPYIKGKKKISGSITIASTLLDIPNYVWDNTYKEKSGIKNLRVNKSLMSETCSQNSHMCPPKMITKFTRKHNKECPVENCSNTHGEIFIGMEQKMVDTMMVCDIMSCIDEDLVKEVVVASNDTDLLPSLLLCKLKSKENKSVTLLNTKKSFEQKSSSILSSYGINVKLLKDEF